MSDGMGVLARLRAALRARLHSARASIDAFMAFAAREVGPGERVLDAGAGRAPYRELFAHARYEATDFEEIFHEGARAEMDFLCSLEEIPRPDATYDAIINTQVLEHVEHPQKVADEFYRILKPGGRLFLTAPQGQGVHHAPHHYFNFTRYGLESLFRHAGFEVVFIREAGGVFRCLAHILRKLPSHVYRPYRRARGLRARLAAAALLPLYLAAKPVFGFALPLVLPWIDPLDRRKAYTILYSCYCRKPAAEA